LGAILRAVISVLFCADRHWMQMRLL